MNNNKKYTLSQLIKDVRWNNNFKYNGKFNRTIKIWEKVNDVFCAKDLIGKYITINRFNKNSNTFAIRIWCRKKSGKTISVHNLLANSKEIEKNVKLLNMVLREFTYGFVSVKLMSGVERDYLKLKFTGYGTCVSTNIDIKDKMNFQI